MSIYGFARGVVKSVLTPLFRVEIIGKENIPKDAGVIVCSNHISNFDPPVVGMTFPRPVYFMAKAELFKVPVLKTLLPKIYAFPVKRGLSDRDALRKGISILKEGGALGLFPEGSRSKDGKLGKGMAGVGFFALRSNAVIVPCAVIGPYKPFKKLQVVYGKPIDVTEMRKERVSSEEVTEVVMKEIGLLLDKYQ
ncbi:lysophospholipid acyltransferase family protein [Priestia endophytica]|jgi:1-acyl-sn-glycerol-3-phosphate acyltransferase|uniref:1-acyl-sn-glycerol-3-phosphate acyltransferase n=2 Tax=Priestia endophytica TaxID=135735 RepID=A0A329EY98_9BACI|nr:lysophospholipid acyltransferase family protein [Priestia endophytica]KAB2493762.1 1-acyl-sn-glycerol-3-phosphate acyltransferase [Priestia endophytica]KYG35907.1 acyl-phosphate glycerol 3-phosphate acyltransferase [Priestia endophytica]MBG9814852.1 acyl-phosphate glycerol 3-phosphate acyltransferase [Priestia endophytica]MCM3539430.1 1-acyl-sn-glycerol-3-phosphate acyltransferase [Priestia endophytica]MED4070379.1 lysophospholipid acyltransferase family protein [Priestia endophytica]